MRPTWLQRLRASVFGTPLYIAAVGLVLTSLVAVLQQSNQVRERELLFESEVARIEHAVEDAIIRQSSEFESSISFNSATHPASLAEYRAFFDREFEIGSELDPGILLVESVAVDEFEEFEARERALNRDDFAIVTPFPTASDERLVVTRTGRDVAAFDFPLLGLDVTAIAPLILPPEVPGSGFAVRIVEPQPLLQMVFPDADVEADFGPDGVKPAVATLIGEVDSPTGELIGYTARFVDVAELVAPIRREVRDDLRVELVVEGITGPVAVFGSSPEEMGTPQFAQSRSQVSATLHWQINVYANDEFGATLGLIEHNNVWLLGLALSLIAALMVVVSEYHRRKLDEAAFEVEHALALASTDPLTGLLNRQGLIDSARAIDDNESATLFFIDLDGFKVVNDADGHDEGDRVLREVARRLRDICRPEDFVCRLGGDEFVMFTPSIGSPEHMAEVSVRITTALAAIDPRVTSSVGVASRLAMERTDVKELLRTADRAMYEAKRAGGDRFSASVAGQSSGGGAGR